jgi:thiol-disulfide isomerase/thioredoxin
MNSPVTDYDKGKELQDAYNRFADTYALILYKNGQYDSAFYYQNAIYQQGWELNNAGLEHYAAYSEIIKGAIFTKLFIETHLLKGVKSPVLLKQLQAIYRQLNLPADEFNNLQRKSNLIARQKTTEAIKARYGTLKAKDFALKNIKGETVVLSSFKNKVVVLDFWATWCAPCKASFPSMQELVNNYKQDSDVVFLFIDVWENKTPQKMQEEALRLTKDNNYSFNVLLDINDKVVSNFKVEGIPQKFVIDKRGNIVYTGDASGSIASMGDSIDEIGLIIEAAKK